MPESISHFSRNNNGRSKKLHSYRRWALLVGGGALTVYGLTRKSKAGAAMAAAGGSLAIAAAKLPSTNGEYLAEASVTISVPEDEAFRFWRNPDNMPRFMDHVKSVRQLAGNRIEMVAGGPLGKELRWQSEITDVRENQWITWRTLPGSDLQSTGAVQFEPAPGGRGTVVSAAMQFRPPGGAAGKLIAKALHRDPSFVLRENLRRFKALLETGEVPTTEGQPHGRRSLVISMLQNMVEGKKAGRSEKVSPVGEKVS